MLIWQHLNISTEPSKRTCISHLLKWGSRSSSRISRSTLCSSESSQTYGECTCTSSLPSHGISLNTTKIMSSRQHEGPHGSSRLDRLNSLKNIILPLIQFLEKLYSPIRLLILSNQRFWVILALKYISTYMFFAGLEVNGFYVIRPSITPYNDTAASATRNH